MNDRIDELAAEIIGYKDPKPGQLSLAKAAMVDPTVWIGFIQAIIAAIRECRENRAEKLARRARKGRKRVVKLLTKQIQTSMIDTMPAAAADKTTVRELQFMSLELAKRTCAKAAEMDRDELVDAVEELQDQAEGM